MTQAQPNRQDSTEDEPAETPKASTAATDRHEKLTEDVDGILDEIDDVLESNAEDFVRSFVQKGGQ